MSKEEHDRLRDTICGMVCEFAQDIHLPPELTVALMREAAAHLEAVAISEKLGVAQ